MTWCTDFHKTPQGLRFTLPDPARREVLDHLLELNHQRYDEEVAQGLHENGKSKGKKSGSKSRKRSSPHDQEGGQLELPF